MRHPDDHPDEGTIHAWLDGALSGDEARAVEAHVTGCARCADAVAEARGLIAAASGILAKLDAVPSGVVPSGVVPRPAAAPPRGAEIGTPVVPIEGLRRERRRAPWWRATSLRVAAALLVVASGTFAVVREQRATPEGADSIVGFSVNRGAQRATSATAAAAVAAPAQSSPVLDTRGSPEVAVPQEAEATARMARRAPASPRADVAPMPAAPAPPPAPAAAQSLAQRATVAPAAPERAGVVGTVAGGAGAAGAGATDSSAVVSQSLAARDARREERAANVADAAARQSSERAMAKATEGARQPARQPARLRVAEPPAAARSAAAPSGAPSAGHAAGCYELQPARWMPAEPRLATPHRLVLDTVPEPPPEPSSRETGFVVRAVGPGAAAWRPGYWLPLAGDSVRVVWNDGTTGIELRARIAGDTLRGGATTFPGDARRVVQRAAVSARRVGCAAP